MIACARAAARSVASNTLGYVPPSLDHGHPAAAPAGHGPRGAGRATGRSGGPGRRRASDRPATHGPRGRDAVLQPSRAHAGARGTGSQRPAAEPGVPRRALGAARAWVAEGVRRIPAPDAADDRHELHRCHALRHEPGQRVPAGLHGRRGADAVRRRRQQSHRVVQQDDRRRGRRSQPHDEQLLPEHRAGRLRHQRSPYPLRPAQPRAPASSRRARRSRTSTSRSTRPRPPSRAIASRTIRRSGSTRTRSTSAPTTSAGLPVPRRSSPATATSCARARSWGPARSS